MVLVTGTTGLVGSHLMIQLLEQGENVRAIYRNATSLEKTKSVFRLYQRASLFQKIEWIKADITDVPSLDAAFQNIEYVYHCAALISFDPKDEMQLRKTNIEGTANIVNFCLNYQIKKLCYVSSIAALGDLKPDEHTITEDTEWNPEATHSDYAISKYGAEMEIWRGQQEGLNISIVNPGVIIGPGFWDAGSGLLFTRVANGLPFFTKGTAGFVAVSDVVKALIQIMKSDTNGERFILVAENISFEKIMKTVANALNVKPPRIYGHPWMTGIYWRIDWLLSQLFGMERKCSKIMSHSLHQIQEYSNEKIKRQLSFEFQNIELSILEVTQYFPKK